MPRGFVWGEYRDRAGNGWALRVDADHFLSPQRGWVSALPGTAPLPRGWLPRVVVGVDPAGSRRRAVVAQETADLWTGASVTFDVEASDNTVVTCTVVGRLSERSFGSS